MKLAHIKHSPALPYSGKKKSVHRQLISQITIVWKLGNHFVSGINTQRICERKSTKMAMSVSRLLDLLSLSMVSQGWGTYIDTDINLYDRDWSGTLHSCVLSPEISQLPSDETLLPEHG